MDAQFSFDQGETSHHCFELLYWINKTQRLVSFLKPIYPAKENGFTRVLFGGVCQRRILIGYEKGIFEYRITDNQLHPVLHQDLVSTQRYHTRKYCVTSDIIVMCGGEEYDYVQNRKVEILTFLNASDKKLTKLECPNLLPYDINEDHVLFYLGHDKILLLGGSRYCVRCGYNYIIDNDELDNVKCTDDEYCVAGGKLVFEGTINSVKDNIIWKQTKSLNNSRISSIIIKMKNYVYVAGGKSSNGNVLLLCERLNLITQCWEQTGYCLPFKISVEHSSVVLNKDESEAMIFGCECLVCRKHDCDLVVIFNEINGFFVAKEKKFSTKIYFSNINHIAVVQ